MRHTVNLPLHIICSFGGGHRECDRLLGHQISTDLVRILGTEGLAERVLVDESHRCPLRRLAGAASSSLTVGEAEEGGESEDVLPVAAACRDFLDDGEAAS